MLLTRSPLVYPKKGALPFDLHVLSTPPAFVLSQDQTLHRKKFRHTHTHHYKQTQAHQKKFQHRTQSPTNPHNTHKTHTLQGPSIKGKNKKQTKKWSIPKKWH